MSVAEQLQQTPRGRLKYDRRRVNLQSIEDVLEEIHADMDSLQVRVAVPRSPAGYSSPPSFGLSSSDSEEELGTPLHPRATRMTCRGPWSPRASGSAASPATRSPATRSPATRSPATRSPASRSPASRASGNGRADPDTGSSAQSPASQRETESSLNRCAEPNVEQEPERSVQRSQERSQERSGAPEEGLKASTPRHGSAPTPFTPRAFDKLLHDERQRHLEEAKASARARLAAAEETVRQLREQHEQRQHQLMAAQQQRSIQQREQRSQERQRTEQQLRQQQENIRQRQQLDAKDLSERVQAAVQQQQADEEARRQKAAQQREKLDLMVAAQKQMHTIFAQVFNSIKDCADRGRLQRGPAASQMEQLKQLLARMDRLTAGSPDQLSIPEAEAAVSEAAQLAVQVTAAVDEINSSVAAAQAAKEAKSATEAAAAAKPAAPAPASPAVTVPVPIAAAASAASGQSTSAAGAGQLGDAVLEEDRVRYTELQKRAAQFRAQFSDLLADPAHKKFKFDCQKAINVPINAISPVSTAHLRDKLDKLRQLLRGQPVAVTGGQVSATAHPHGVAFCLDLVAKKFVRQGEDVVSSKPEAAFALAAVLRALQLEFPELGELTLAHCQARCPYLVPLYPPQLDGDTNEQYYRKLGYDYADGVVEKQDKFLKRMSGIARLYVALLIARPPQSAPAPAPAGGGGLGVKHLWRWLAATVNLEPRADVTASLLLDVLEVGGSTLSALYGTQFVKLVRLIGIHYLPRVQQATPAGCGGPVVRLEQQLHRIITTGRVPPPQGELKLYNW